MNSRPWLAFAIAMLMFAQIVETMYSPALVDIGLAFKVPPALAAQTLSCYFIAFAVGVLLWGRLCDVIGRRPCVLAGLSLYAVASVGALLASDFSQLLAARVLAAFAAAVGSVVLQTALRDRYQGVELLRVFALIGLCLALSPALGVLSGAWLSATFGYRGVFAALLGLAVLLLGWAWRSMPETRPTEVRLTPLGQTLQRMLRDPQIGLASVLVALLNLSVFSWYSLAPFAFEQLGLTALFGYSGVVLAVAAVLGARLNTGLLGKGWSGARLLRLACLLNLGGALLMAAFADSAGMLLAMAVCMFAFALAIPLVLGSALHAYADCRGSAGALFGLFYYLLLGLGLMLVGLLQALPSSMLVSALLVCLAGRRYARLLTRQAMP